MTCSRDSCITDWQSMPDAVTAWQSCGCMVCQSALDELPPEIIEDAEQAGISEW